MKTKKHITGSSETIRKTTFNFSAYLAKCPSHIRQSEVSPEFLQWFIGFSEGDGSFIVGKDGRRRFAISQKEERVLLNIRTQLGFGKVSRQKSSSKFSKYQSYPRFVVSDKAGVERLIHLFNGNLVLDKTNIRFQAWLYSWNSSRRDKSEKIEYLSRNKLPRFDDNDWLSGFIDADGCFNVIRAVTRSGLGWNVSLRFIIDQKGERELLERVCTWLGSGGVHRRHQVVDMYRFSCTNIASCEMLIEHINKHPLRTIKNVDFCRFASLARYIRGRKTLPWEGKVLKRVENLIARIGQTESDDDVTC